MDRLLQKAIFLILALAWVAPSALGQPAELLLLPEQDDYDNLYTNGQAIVQAGNGDILAFIVANGQGNNPGQLYMYRSSDGGSTWAARESVLTASPGEPQGIFGPSVAVLPSGRLVMLVSVDFAPVVRVSDDNGATWSQIATRPNRFAEKVSVSPSGTLVTVDQRDDGFGNISFWWATSANGGQTWSSGAALPASDPNTTDVVALTDDQWVFVHDEFVFPPGGVTPVNAYVTSDAGATWSDPVELSTAESIFGTVGDLLVDSEGGLTLFYVHGYKVMYRTGSFEDDVFSFGAPVQWTIGTDQTRELRPTCAYSTYGPVCLVRRIADGFNDKPYFFGVPGVTVDPLLGGTSRESGSELPSGLTLSSTYPNPFSGSATIEYELERASNVRLSVYNLLGEEVARLADGLMEAGAHRAVWSADGLPGGVFMIRLSSGGASVVRPATLLR